jgi:hypothetical protein
VLGGTLIAAVGAPGGVEEAGKVVVGAEHTGAGVPSCRFNCPRTSSQSN